MKGLKEILADARKKSGLTMKEVVVRTHIAQAVLSKIENGKRMPTMEQLVALAEVYQESTVEFQKHWLAEKIIKEVRPYIYLAEEAWGVAEPRIEYLTSGKSLKPIELSRDIKERLMELDRLKNKWQGYHPLDQAHLARLQDYYRIKYTSESNQIEGNTLTVRETEMVINKGVTISGKTVTEHLEAINHGHAVEMIYEMVDTDFVYDKRSLMQLHGLILRGIDQRNAGKYREVPVMISGSSHEPPQPFMLDKLMEDYFYHYRNHRKSLHPVILAAEMHERLVSIHPFVDGNGRTSRLVMNLILLQGGFTVTSLKGDYDSRMAYYKALEAVQVDSDPEPFYNLVIDAVEESLRSHLKWVHPS